MDPNDEFAQIVCFASQAGFAVDFAPAIGCCKSTWEDERFWDLLVPMASAKNSCASNFCLHVKQTFMDGP